MTNKIYEWANIISEETENGGEPSFNDVNQLIKINGKTEDTITKDEYENLSDKEKEDIHSALSLAKTLEIDNDKALNQGYSERHKAIGSNMFKYENALGTIINPGKEKYFVNFIETNFKTYPKKGSDKRGINVFASEDSAKDFISKRMKVLEEKRGIKPEDFEEIDPSDERFPNKIKNDGKDVKMFQCKLFQGDKKDALLKHATSGTQLYYKHDGQIKKPKEWAAEIGMDYQKFLRHIKSGKLQGFEQVNAMDRENVSNKEDGNTLPPDQEYSKVKVDMVYTYIIYKAKSPIPYENWQDNLADALNWSNMSQEERDKYQKRKQRRQDYLDKQTRDAKEFTKNLSDFRGKKDIIAAKMNQSNALYGTNDPFDLEGTDNDNFEDFPDMYDNGSGERAPDTDNNPDDDDEYKQYDYSDDWEEKQRRSSDSSGDSDEYEDNQDIGRDYDYNQTGSNWGRD